MDNIFRIKKSRDGVSKSKVSDTVSGTLDSIHQKQDIQIYEWIPDTAANAQMKLL